jgi:hypothetical protein
MSSRLPPRPPPPPPPPLLSSLPLASPSPPLSASSLLAFSAPALRRPSHAPYRGRLATPPPPAQHLSSPVIDAGSAPPSPRPLDLPRPCPAPPPPELRGVHRGYSSPSPSVVGPSSPRSGGGQIWASHYQICHPHLVLALGRRWSGSLASSGPPPPLSAADPSNPRFVHRRLCVPRVCRRPGYAAAARFESRLTLFWLGREGRQVSIRHRRHRLGGHSPPPSPPTHRVVMSLLRGPGHRLLGHLLYMLQS